MPQAAVAEITLTNRSSRGAPADLRVETRTCILRPVRSIRRHIAVRVVTCFLLTWATADLLVPQLCSSEQGSQESGSPSGPQDRDDCFCCCSHVVKAPIVTVMHSQGVPVIVERSPSESLAAGVPRGVYHPPLLS